MAISMGSPVLKLDRQNHFGKKDKHAGNAQAVLEEMFPDEEGVRHSSDRDYNPELTKNNLFYEFDYETGKFNRRDTITSKEVVDKYYSEADNYKITDKNGKQKSLRADAVICVGGILKPAIDSEEWIAMNEQEKLKFLKTSVALQAGLLKKRGIQIEFFTVHMDEANPHIHWVGKDKTYQMGKKVGLPMFRDFNEKLPELLQAKGYNVKQLSSFDSEAYKNLSDEEKQEYIKQKKAKKKENGQKSEDYKKQKEIERAKAEELKELRAKAAEYDKLIEKGTISIQLANEYERNIEKYKREVNRLRKTFNQTLVETREIKDEILSQKTMELQETMESLEALDVPEKPEANEFTQIIEERAEHYEKVDREDTNRYAKTVKEKPKARALPDVPDTSWQDEYERGLKEIQEMG